MVFAVCDVETNGFLDELTKVHVLSYALYNDTNLIAKKSLTSHEEMAKWLALGTTLVGHNFVRFDKPALEKVLGVKLKNKIIDTLALSWYLYPYGASFKHGLAAWGERLGFGKPVVEDWDNQPLEVYVHRCESDVEINSRLFLKQMQYLVGIYGENGYDPIINYLGFKMACLREQEEHGITLDKRLCETEKHNLEFVIDEKIDILAKGMPQVLEKSAPKVMYKKNGDLSAHGAKWKAKLKSLGLPEDSDAIYKRGNPGSNKQLKEWLLSLGWVPQTFKVSTATGEDVPQVSNDGGICPSVQALYAENQDLQHLEGLFVAKHRFGLFKSFLEAEAKRGDGKVVATAHGFTNTLRLQHSKPVVNLPGVDKYYGDKVRGALTVPNDNYTMIGSDISGLEDNTKMHWMYFFDPKYVDQMRTPGFDGHINIAVFAGMMSTSEEKFYKKITKQMEEQGNDFEWAQPSDKAEYKALAAIRKKAKPVNFGGQYGIGPAKLAEQLKIPLSEAKALHTAYWELNKSVKQVAAATTVKTVHNQEWQYNPISGLWYFLKAEKDRFSTLNQGSGVYVCDMWINKMRQKGIKVVMQYHDEVLIVCPNQDVEHVTMALKDAMVEVNMELQLNVNIGISVDVGKNYADCH